MKVEEEAVAESLLLGPRSEEEIVLRHARAAHAQVDEAAAVAELLGGGADRVMVDVGANRGFALAPFADLGWEIHAFEPEPTSRATLTERFGHCPSVRIDPRALGEDERRGVPFFTSAESSGIGTLRPFRESHAQTAVTDVTTLRHYAEEVGLEHIDFLKVDTEGFDLFVLRGVPWEKLRPRVVLCEFEDQKTVPLGYDVTTLGDLLIERGYVVYVSEWYPIRRYGIPHDWHALARYPCPLQLAGAWGNLLAFDRDHAPSEAALVEAVRAHTRFRGRADHPDGLNDLAARRVSFVTDAATPDDLGEQIATAALYLSSVVVDELAIVTASTVDPVLDPSLDADRVEAARELAPRCRRYLPDAAPRVDTTLTDDPRTDEGERAWLALAAAAQPGEVHQERRNLRALRGLRRRLGRFDRVDVLPDAAEPVTDDALRFVGWDAALSDEASFEDAGPTLIVVVDPSGLCAATTSGAEARDALVHQTCVLGRSVIVRLEVFGHLVGLRPEIESHVIGLGDTLAWRPYEPPDGAGPIGSTLLPLACLFGAEVVVHATNMDEPHFEASLIAAEEHGVPVRAPGWSRWQPGAELSSPWPGEDRRRLLFDPEALGSVPEGLFPLGPRDGGGGLAWFTDRVPLVASRVVRERFERELRLALEFAGDELEGALLRGTAIDGLLAAIGAGTGIVFWLAADDVEGDADGISVALRASRSLREARRVDVAVSTQAIADAVERIAGERPLVMEDARLAVPSAVQLQAAARETLDAVAGAIRLARLDGPMARSTHGLRSAESALGRAEELDDAVLRLRIERGALARERDELRTRSRRQQLRLEQLTNAVAARDRRIEELNHAVQARDARIAALGDAVAARDRRIEDLNRAVEARDARIRARDAKVAELEEPARRWNALASAPRVGAGWVARRLKRRKDE